MRSEHKSFSHPLTTFGDGSVPSPSLVSATGAMGFASRKAVNRHLSNFLVCCYYYYYYYYFIIIILLLLLLLIFGN